MTSAPKPSATLSQSRHPQKDRNINQKAPSRSNPGHSPASFSSTDEINNSLPSMPAQRKSSIANTDNTDKTDLSPKNAASGWTKEEKSLLLKLLISHGERDFKSAVPGKTGHQVRIRLSLTDG